MTNILKPDAAKQLIEFISNTNYRLCPEGDFPFKSAEEAINYVESDQYDPSEPINVCFDTKQGNFSDTVVAYFNGTHWRMEDLSMGGAHAIGTTIEEALVKYREKFDVDDKYCPVELILNCKQCTMKE